MKNWLIILLVAAVVAAGAFLPELLLKWSRPPELDMEVQQVAVTSQSSSDYTWRMGTLAESFYGEGEQLLTTYISQTDPEESEGEEYAQFLAEFDRLTRAGVMPQEARDLLRDDTDYRIRYYYMFDSQAVSGFRYAEFTAAASNWRIHACMDVESGRLVRLDYGGSRLFPGGDITPQTSWYDVLRGFGQYLGLSEDTVAVEAAESQGARKYYDSITADRRTAPVAAGGSAWLELRVLRENYMATVTVYRDGK